MSDAPQAATPSLGSGALQERAVRGVAWTMLHTVVAIPVAFLVNLLLARVLGAADYGRLAYLTTLMGIAASILALGLSSAMIQFGSKAHAAGRTDEVRRILSASQGFRLLVVAPLLTILIIVLVDLPTPLLAVGLLFGVWLPAAFDGAVIGLFIENKTATGAKVAMVTNMVVQAGVVVAILTVGRADAVWATRLACSGIAAGVAIFAIDRVYRRAVLRPALPRRFPAGFWRFAIPTGAAALIGDLVISRTEVLLLQSLSTPEAVGLFALAFGVSSHVFAPAHALTGPLIPAIAGMREVNEPQVAAAFGRTLRASGTVVALVTAGALPALTLLVPALYGQEFAQAAPAVIALGCVGAFGVATAPVSAFVLARLSARVFLVANITALAVNVASALVLIPTFGMWGAVVANAGGTLTQAAILMVTEYRALRLPFGGVLGSLAPVFLGVAASAGSWALLEQRGWPSVIGAPLASGCAVGALLLGLLVTRTGLTTHDRDAIVRVLPSRLKGAGHLVLSLVTRHRG